MVNPHEMLNSCVKVMYVDGVLGNIVTPIVCLTVGDAALYTTTGEPDGKTARMMVSSKGFCIAALPVNRSAEFSAPNNECILE